MSKKIIRIAIFIIPIIIIICIFTKKMKAMPNNLNRLCINEIMANNFGYLKNENGNYNDWIEIYNGSGKTINLAGYGLTNNKNSLYKWIFPDIQIESNKYILVFAGISDGSSNLYTGFNLDISGGELFLTDNEGNIVDSFNYGKQSCNISYGRLPLDYDELLYYSKATPGEKNDLLFAFTSDDAPLEVKYNLSGGLYTDSRDIELKADKGVILYTLDGSIPNENSSIYKNPIKVNEKSSGDGTVIRARVYYDNKLGEIYTNTYFVKNEKDSYPIVALTVDPEEMFGNNGIYMAGSIDNLFRYRGIDDPFAGNYILQESIDSYFELMDDDYIASAGKLEITGEFSRAFTKKSFNFRLDSPINYLDYKLDGVKLRSSGSGETYANSYIDNFINDVSYELDLGITKSRIVNIYINGEYWGIYTLQELIDNSFWKNNYDIEEGEIAVIRCRVNNSLSLRPENLPVLWKGNSNDYEDYENFFDELFVINPVNEEDYKWIASKVDIDQFTDYIIVESFFHNSDWIDNNIIIWKYKGNHLDNKYKDGRWRFRLFDMDTTMSNDSINDFYIDQILAFDIDKDYKKGLVALLLQKLMSNDTYRKKFYERYDELLNSSLSVDRMLDKYDSQKDLLYKEMERNYNVINAGYAQAKYLSSDASYDVWKEEMDKLRENIIRRHEYVTSEVKRRLEGF